MQLCALQQPNLEFLVKDLLLSLLEPWFQFLVEVRSHKLNGTGEKKNHQALVWCLLLIKWDL